MNPSFSHSLSEKAKEKQVDCLEMYVDYPIFHTRTENEIRFKQQQIEKAAKRLFDFVINALQRDAMKNDGVVVWYDDYKRVGFNYDQEFGNLGIIVCDGEAKSNYSDYNVKYKICENFDAMLHTIGFSLFSYPRCISHQGDGVDGVDFVLQVI